MVFILHVYNIYPLFSKINRIMSTPMLLENNLETPIQSASIQRLLDVIASIIADEYISAAKQNRAVFVEIASGPSVPRNGHNDIRR